MNKNMFNIFPSLLAGRSCACKQPSVRSTRSFSRVPHFDFVQSRPSVSRVAPWHISKLSKECERTLDSFLMFTRRQDCLYRIAAARYAPPSLHLLDRRYILSNQSFYDKNPNLIFHDMFSSYSTSPCYKGATRYEGTSKSVSSNYKLSSVRRNLHNTSMMTTPLGYIKLKEFQESKLKSFDTFCSIGSLTVAQTQTLQKLINLCMLNGKKSKSNKIILNTLYQLSKKHKDVLDIFLQAVENIKPVLEVRKIRISGTTQLVPSIILQKRQYSLALRWIVEAAKKRRNTKKNMSLDQCLLAELIDAYHNIGTVRKKKDDLHKLAESNRGFAHYRWW